MERLFLYRYERGREYHPFHITALVESLAPYRLHSFGYGVDHGFVGIETLLLRVEFHSLERRERDELLHVLRVQNSVYGSEPFVTFRYEKLLQPLVVRERPRTYLPDVFADGDTFQSLGVYDAEIGYFGYRFTLYFVGYDYRIAESAVGITDNGHLAVLLDPVLEIGVLVCRITCAQNGYQRRKSYGNDQYGNYFFSLIFHRRSPPIRLPPHRLPLRLRSPLRSSRRFRRRRPRRILPLRISEPRRLRPRPRLRPLPP